MKSAFRKVCRLAGQAVGTYDLIREGDRLLLGLSGGKDSMVLLQVLLHFREHAPVSFELECATFDPGFPGFDSAGTEAFCRQLGVKHHTVSLDMPSLLREKNAESRPCVLCSRLRRGNLYHLAETLHCNKLVLGQHLDDVLASFLISLVRGGGLTTMGPNVPAETHSLRVIRPLVFVPESLIREAAAEFDFPVRGVCQYRSELEENGDRAWAEQMISSWEKHIPGVRENMLHSLCDVRPPWLLDKRFLDTEKQKTV